jgi:hypothetical protein
MEFVGVLDGGDFSVSADGNPISCRYGFVGSRMEPSE